MFKVPVLCGGPQDNEAGCSALTLQGCYDVVVNNREFVESPSSEAVLARCGPVGLHRCQLYLLGYICRGLSGLGCIIGLRNVHANQPAGTTDARLDTPKLPSPVIGKEGSGSDAQFRWCHLYQQPRRIRSIPHLNLTLDLYCAQEALSSGLATSLVV